jgi:hypothetical protein
MIATTLARVDNERLQRGVEGLASGLEKLEDPPSLVRLRQAIKARLPRGDLPEILLEITARTNFTAQFTHGSEHGARVDDLSLSVCAVL